MRKNAYKNALLYELYGVLFLLQVLFLQPSYLT